MSKGQNTRTAATNTTNAPGTSGKRPWAAVVLVLVLAAAAAWFWGGRDPAKREVMLSVAESTLKEAETVLSGVVSKAKEFFPRETPPVPPVGEGGQATGQTAGQGAGQGSGQTKGQTAGQTGQAGQAGQTGSQTTGQMTPQGGAQAGGLVTLPGGATRPTDSSSQTLSGETARGLLAQNSADGTPPVTGRTDDAVVRVAFIDDLARWMVSGYTPASGRSGRGSIAVGVQSANARYGTGMKGLAWIGDDLPAGRVEALRYVYTPGMLDALYRLYIDRFMLAMSDASAEPRAKTNKVLEPTQIADMYQLYAARFRALSGTMQGVAVLSDLRQRMQKLQDASQSMVASNTKYMEEVFAFDQAREKGNQAAIDKARRAMEVASDAYQRSMLDRDRLREALAGAIRNNPDARMLGDDNLLYVAHWVDRRLQQSPVALDATLQAATLFLDLAQRFEQAAGLQP